ncbi:protein kinase [Schaalia sp. 19OD2882]|uniref:serine/threonine-protein kinase n=1 Tax=Schaalia sp. 19OD2882 TaxID=2794089 RepID=UPI001C1E9F6D|nr:serine/threonine-protein kinase [Schaalia sp. 19OD2882]QWW19528.1 protein kinase [Schaalia sp. 19OD2882]
MSGDQGTRVPTLGANYRLTEVIGRGATGEVWRAVDTRTHNEVAAKILRPEHMENQDLLDRFMRERSILLGLRGPGVVPVLDLVVDGGRLGIVMEYVPGGSLRDVLRAEGTLAPNLAVRVCARILDSLALARGQGIVHRDVKPDNVLLSNRWRRTGEADVRLVDFGVAGIVAAGQGHRVSGILGTPEYMSPELVSTGSAGPEGDVYGVGVVLYELLCGHTPFGHGAEPMEVAKRHVRMSAPPLPVPADLWRALSLLLAKDPQARPAPAEAAGLLRGLAPALESLPALPGPDGESTPTPTYHPATMAFPLVERTPPAPAEPKSTSTPLSFRRSRTPSAATEPLTPLAPVHVPAPDVGEPVGHTVVQPLTPPSSPVQDEPEEETPPSLWARVRRPRTLVPLIALVCVALAVGGWFIHRHLTRVDSPHSTTPQSVTGPVSATERGTATPTGLGTELVASVETTDGSVRLTVTYSAENAPLQGPFLLVLPPLGDEGGCPSISWESPAAVTRNSTAVTGVSTECGWALDPGPIAPKSTTQIKARVAPDTPLDTQALSTWLRSVHAATAQALADPAVVGNAYPVQRLSGIQVRVPSRVVVNTPVPVTVVPVWPSGTDEANPVYVSPSSGAPSTVLQAIAGGEAGVQFSDGCAGSVVVAKDGHSVAAVGASAQCTLKARVGNFLNLDSNTFAVVNSGG